MFWLVKMMSTTVGETAADLLNFTLHLGLTGVSILTGILLAIALFFQMSSRVYEPLKYWLTVVLISVFGTLVTDNLTDHFGVPLALSTGVFSVFLAVVFAIWYAREKTLSIHHVDSPAREGFYWLAILTTFALGTASGDWFAEGLQLGYLVSTLIFLGMIAAITFAWAVLRANAVLCFWLAYILTRPLGAAFGDWLAQPKSHGGLGLGVNGTSVIFLVAISAMVGVMIVKQKRSPAPALKKTEQPEKTEQEVVSE